MKQHPIPILLIAVVSIALYANTLQNGLVYDDYLTIVDNAFIKNLNNLSGLFNPDIYFAASGEMSYRPVVTFTYFMDYAIYGLKAWGFHLTNALLHAVNGILLYSFISLLIGNRWVSFTSTIIFITHPILTEAVNAISYREDLLAFLFYMTALNLFLILRSPLSARGAWVVYSFSCLSYIFALFSKEMAITLPLVVFIYGWISARERNVRSLSSNYYFIGLVAISFIYLLLRFTYLYNPRESHVSGWELSERLYTIPWLLVSYMKLIFFPVSLSAVHVFRPISPLSSPIFMVSFIAIIVLLIFTLWRWEKKKEIAFGALFFFIALLPVYNIIPLNNPFAERYLYLPMAGIAIMASGLVNLLCNAASIKETTPMRIAYLIPLAVFFSINCLAVTNRNSIWKNERSFRTDALKKSPENPRTHDGMGVVYFKEGRLEKAINEFQTAIKIDSRYSPAHANLGIAYNDMGRLDDALYHLNEAVRLNPYHQAAHLSLGVACHKLDLLNEARRHYTTAIRLNPFDLKGYNNLGFLYSQMGRSKEAVRHFETAIRLDLLDVTPRTNLADLYLKIGEYGKAVDEYRIALKINPNDPKVNKNLGITLYKMGRVDKR